MDPTKFKNGPPSRVHFSGHEPSHVTCQFKRAMQKDARVMQSAAACSENHSGPFSDAFLELGFAEWWFSNAQPVFRSDSRKKVLLRSRFASEFLYMANGTGFGPVRAVQEYVKFDVASAAFGSFSIWHIEFLYTHLKDSVVSTRVVFIRWLCRFLFCLSVCLFGWVGGWVGWFVGWLICLVCFFLVLFWFGLV